MPEQITESLEIAEAESLGNGRYRVLCISEGKGSSGVYPRETLIEAANKRLIGRQTFAYLDHPSATEHHDRPERSVRDLAGVFTSEAVWDETHKGLVAEMQVFAPYRELIAEMKDHIGLSIRGDGEVEMREGQRTVTSLAHIESVDFVTRAGRGGKVLSLLESARPGFDADDMAATTGVPNNATPDPLAPVAEVHPLNTPKEGLVPELTEAEVTALRDSAAQAEAARDAALAEAATAKTALAEATARQAARAAVAAKVSESKTLGARTQSRVVESVVAALPVADGTIADDTLTAAVEAAVTTAEAEIADYAPAAPTGLFGTFGSVTESATGDNDIDATFTKTAGSAFGRNGN